MPVPFNWPAAFSVNGVGAAIEAAVHGIGIVHALSYQVERQIAEGALLARLPDYEPLPIPVHPVFTPRQCDGSAVRVFLDHAVPLLRRAANWRN